MERMQNNPILSIIMPIYNAREFLSDSIGDVLAQTFENFELICIDDGSSDGSGQILDSFAKNDRRITVIHQENCGGGAARNAGLDAAAGKYLLFLDADDRFEPELAKRVILAAEETGAEVVAYGGDVFDALTGRHASAPWLLRTDAEPTAEDPFHVMNTSVWNKLFLKEHILGNKIRFQENRIVDTMYFVFCAVVYAKRLSSVRDVLIHYRTNNEKSILSNSDRHPLEAYEALLMVHDKLEQDGIFGEKKRIFAEYAAEYLVSRLGLMKSDTGFCALYGAIHEGGVEKLGIGDVPKSEKNSRYMRELKKILEQKAEGYLFDKIKQLRKLGMIRKETYILPLTIKDEKYRIVIYGGGSTGKDYFLQAMEREDIELAGWVDKNYQNIGFPLQSPETLEKLQYEMIVIAAAHRSTAMNIKEALTGMGIPEEKVCWYPPAVL